LPPRLLNLFLCLLLYACCSGQDNFQGRITYRSGDTGFLSLRASCYFGDRKVRLEVNYPRFPGSEYAYSPYELFDERSNIVYIAEPRSRLLQKIILDTPWAAVHISKKRLDEKKSVLGYSCYGIETIIPNEESDSADDPLMIRHVGWYAETLPSTFIIPFPLALHGITDNGNICLLMETTLFNKRNTSSTEIDFVAEHIEPGSPDRALFVLPEGYETLELKASEMFRKK
jgi:hypothetical protein